MSCSAASFDAEQHVAADRPLPPRLDVRRADDDGAHLETAAGRARSLRHVVVESGLAPRGAVPAVAQGGVDQLARRGHDLGAVRRDRSAGRDDHHRHRVARTPRLGRQGRTSTSSRSSRRRHRMPTPARSARCSCGRPTDENIRTYRYVGAEARRIDGGWESLGDMGMIDADGYLYLSDRQTDMILAGGANIYPAEIEAALDEHPRVRSSRRDRPARRRSRQPRARDRADRRRHRRSTSTNCALISPTASSATRFRARSSSPTSRSATTPARCGARPCVPNGSERYAGRHGWETERTLLVAGPQRK